VHGRGDQGVKPVDVALAGIYQAISARSL